MTRQWGENQDTVDFLSKRTVKTNLRPVIVTNVLALCLVRPLFASGGASRWWSVNSLHRSTHRKRIYIKDFCERLNIQIALEVSVTMSRLLRDAGQMRDNRRDSHSHNIFSHYTFPMIWTVIKPNWGKPYSKRNCAVLPTEGTLII